MTSLVLRRRQQTLAQIAATGSDSTVPGAPPMPEDGPVATEYQLLLMAMGEDLRQLHNMMERSRKIEAKRVMIARYLPWVEGALAAEVPAQDEIVVTMMIWAIDIGNWPLSLRLAKHVIENALALPERYNRTAGTLIAEEVAEAGLLVPPEVDLDTILAIDALTADLDMHDQARAKLFKAKGLALKARADAFDPTAESAMAGGKAALVEAALDAFHAALGKDSKSGVKKLIEAMEREAKKLGALSDTPTNVASGSMPGGAEGETT
jgi:hypothetical protein